MDSSPRRHDETGPAAVRVSAELRTARSVAVPEPSPASPVAMTPSPPVDARARDAAPLQLPRPPMVPDPVLPELGSRPAGPRRDPSTPPAAAPNETSASASSTPQRGGGRLQPEGHVERVMPPGVPPTWDVPDVALPRLLADAVRDFPDVVALSRRGGADLTHVQFAGLVDRLALGMAERGVRRVVVLDARPSAIVVLAQAAWRLGVPLVTGAGESAGAPAVDVVADPAQPDLVDFDVADPAPPDADPAAPTGPDGPAPQSGAPVAASLGLLDFSQDHDLVVGSRRRLHDLRVPAAAMLVDDLQRIPVDGVTGLAGARDRTRRIARRFTRRDHTSLTGMLEHTTQGALPAVASDAVAVIRLDGGTRRSFTHANLVAAAFQTRLWIPDMAAGSERVAAAMDLRGPAALALGPVLAALTGATLRCDQDPATTIAGATIAFGEVETWRGIARRHGRRHRLQRGDGSPSTLRVGGVVTTSIDDLLPAVDVRAMMAHTEGARLRHFWSAPSACGPVAGQPVYGRVHGALGAEPVTNTMVVAMGDRVRARGPQFAAGDGDDAGWTDVTGSVPAMPAAPSRPVLPRRPAPPRKDAR